MRQIQLVPVCLAALVLQIQLEGVIAAGRSFSEGISLRTSASGGVSSPAELEEQEENMEVLEEASPLVASRPTPSPHPQVFLQSSAPFVENPAAASFDALPEAPRAHSGVHAARKWKNQAPEQVSDTARPIDGKLAVPPSLRKPGAETLQQKKRTKEAAEEAILMQAPVKQPWPPPSKRTKCHPECMEGRGTCNDNVCFCKSPYTGVSCQHKIQDLSRFPIPLVIAFGIFCAIVGCILARIIYWIPLDYCSFCVPSVASHSAPGTVKKEVWHPPEPSSKKKQEAPKPQASADQHPHLSGHDDHT